MGTKYEIRKAKDYAQDILDEYIQSDALTAASTKGVAAIRGLLEEVDEICKVRKITQYRGILSTLKEQHIKWLSICRQVNKEVPMLNERGFLNLIEKKMTMIYPNLMQII